MSCRLLPWNDTIACSNAVCYSPPFPPRSQWPTRNPASSNAMKDVHTFILIFPSLFTTSLQHPQEANKTMKILVTGATGYIGQYLAYEALPKLLVGSDIVGLGHSSGQNRMDLGSAEDVSGVVAREMPDVVINCAAISAPAQCEALGQTATDAINAPDHLPQALSQFEAKRPLLIHFSTDQVLPSEPSASKEVDHLPETLSPLNVYGSSKSRFESVLSKSGVPSVVLRCSNVYGKEVGGKGKFLQWVSGALEKGEEVSLFEDEFRSFVYLKDVGEVVARVCTMWEAGGLFANPDESSFVIYHMGGAEPLSRLAFGTAVAKHKGLPATAVRGVPRPTDPKVPSPADITMDSTALFIAVGLKQTLLAEALKEIYPGGCE